MKKIIFIGAPGSGKGTATHNIVKSLDIDIISTGDIFRNIVNENTPIAQQIRDLLNSGELIPDSITNELVKNEVINHIKANKSFILDGYPRNIEQAKFLNEICAIDYAIWFDISNDILIKRVTGRLICNHCKKIYNVYFNPPKVDNLCDECNELLFKRKDDEENAFLNRIKIYNEKTLPITDFYKQQKKLYPIDAAKNSNEVAQDILNIINK